MSEPIGEPGASGKSKEELLLSIRTAALGNHAIAFLDSIVELFEKHNYTFEQMQDFLIISHEPYSKLKGFLLLEDKNLSTTMLLLSGGLFHAIAKSAKNAPDVLTYLKDTREMLDQMEGYSDGKPDSTNHE